ncbi:MAG: phenylalanine--tRNA ligase subunit alpha [Terriglobia bacterium]
MTPSRGGAPGFRAQPSKSNYPAMTIDEKVRQTLADLHAATAEEARSLFDEVRSAAQRERKAVLVSAGSQAANAADFKALRDRWLARKNGIISLIDENWLKTAPKELKPVVGKEFNELRNSIADIGRPAELYPPPAKNVQRPDLTLPGYRRALGSAHPITQVQREIEEIFIGLGFAIESGPEIESVYYNFDALNIPESHPSRDDWDTFYIDSETVLRTHTSPVQVRAMERRGAPLYIVIPGKCYRRDNPDSTHSPMFHQIEGLAVDSNITFADLKGTLDFFARKFFGEETRTSFHASFFPFTEPSGEVSIGCIFCGGNGCRVCKHSGWIEVMGCGMVHPAVLRHGQIDPERYAGWAFGLGVERYAMMRYGIDDIQMFFQSDVRFLEQF